MKRQIERIINELQHDSKIQAMHRENIAKRQALRERRRALMLARHHKAVMVYDDREAKKAAIREGIDQKFNGSALLAEMAYVLGNVEKAIKGKEVKINDEFTDLIDECRKEEEARQAEENRIRREEHAEAVKRHNKLIEHAKNVLGRDDRKAKKAAIRSGIVNKFGGDVGKAIRFYSAVGKEDNQEFNSLFYEVVKELQEEQENDLHKWCENKAEKLARLTGEDKAAIIDRLERGLAA